MAEPRRDWTPQGRHSIVDEPIAELELDTITAWQTELPGVDIVPAGPDIYEVTVPPALDGGHETHLARVLDEFLRIVDDRRWPTALAERTVAKYTLLTAAAARTLGST